MTDFDEDQDELYRAPPKGPLDDLVQAIEGVIPFTGISDHDFEDVRDYEEGEEPDTLPSNAQLLAQAISDLIDKKLADLR